MRNLTRRNYLKQVTLTAAAGVLATTFRSPLLFADAPTALAAPPTPSTSQAAAIAKIVQATMGKFNAPGLSLAIARHGVMVYQQGFGDADKETPAAVTTASLFRIASISKPISSVAIFTLIEQGRLHLEDLVFGEEGILKSDYIDSGGKYPERVAKITIHHLLTHTAGGWQNDGDDPMFQKPRLDHHELITWALRMQPMQNEPGTHYAYSNFGFCILGRVIEKITGQPYAQFVQENVLAKCGIQDMRVGGNTLAHRAPGEVVYYGQPDAGTNPYNMNVARMDAHGGWIGTPSDLVQFAMHVDGFKTTPSLLSAASLKSMTSATTANPNYACGWCVNSVPNWWHGGSLPGTLSIMVRTGSGLC